MIVVETTPNFANTMLRYGDTKTYDTEMIPLMKNDELFIEGTDSKIYLVGKNERLYATEYVVFRGKIGIFKEI